MVRKGSEVPMETRDQWNGGGAETKVIGKGKKRWRLGRREGVIGWKEKRKRQLIVDGCTVAREKTARGSHG